jgi:glycosyltransferase involved in cell wall biosynthesis
VTQPPLTTPVVSVVTAVYNGRDHLRESLESVLGQEGPPLELIVVDDGSTDGSSDVLADLARADPRVRVVRQENRGLTRALIAGCDAARGRYIARHDADDVSLPGRLASQVAHLARHADCAFVSSWSRARGPHDETLWDAEPSADSGIATKAFLEGGAGPSCHGSVMFRRDAYVKAGGYRPEFYFGQDGDLWLRLLEVGAYSVVPKLLYVFRIREGSISTVQSVTQHRYGQIARACRAARLAGEAEAPYLAEAVSLRPLLHTAGPENPLAGAYFIGCCLVRRGSPRGIAYLAKAVRRHPWSARVWLGAAGVLTQLPWRMLTEDRSRRG